MARHRCAAQLRTGRLMASRRAGSGCPEEWLRRAANAVDQAEGHAAASGPSGTQPSAALRSRTGIVWADPEASAGPNYRPGPAVASTRRCTIFTGRLDSPGPGTSPKGLGRFGPSTVHNTFRKAEVPSHDVVMAFAGYLALLFHWGCRAGRGTAVEERTLRRLVQGGQHGTGVTVGRRRRSDQHPVQQAEAAHDQKPLVAAHAERPRVTPGTRRTEGQTTPAAVPCPPHEQPAEVCRRIPESAAQRGEECATTTAVVDSSVGSAQPLAPSSSTPVDHWPLTWTQRVAKARRTEQCRGCLGLNASRQDGVWRGYGSRDLDAAVSSTECRRKS